MTRALAIRRPHRVSIGTMNGTGCRTAAMAPSLLLTPVRCEAALQDCGTSLLCLFYAIATVFQLYHGSDMLDVSDEKEKARAYAFTDSRNL